VSLPALPIDPIIELWQESGVTAVTLTRDFTYLFAVTH
jgi:hypothetical protein